MKDEKIKKNNEYYRGSEWRKWDLHVHTPFSILNNNFSSDWDEYVKELFREAIKNDIAVIGITDYFTINGYKKIKEDYLANEKRLLELFTQDEIRQIRSILVLPNIEFRLNKFVGKNRINFHVLLSDTISSVDIEENFLHDLDFQYDSMPQNETEVRKLTTKNLEDLGQRLITEHEKFANRTPLYVGMMNVVVDDERICSLLSNKRSIFEGKYLIALPADEDLSSVSWDGQDHQARKLLIQKSDILIATNPNTINWALGKKSQNPNGFINEFKSLKPCIGGSDAHTNEELFVKNKGREVWIKADPTFEGLKQIVYEPEDRVKIQENKPEEKNDYVTIDKVIFEDQSFTKNEILINQNLTAIIGGKSTGKTILLRNIAETIDPNEVRKRDDELKLNEDKNPKKVENFIVYWKDKQENEKNKSNCVNKKIIYIPQSYLNRLVDKKEDKTSIDDIVKNILEQQEDVKNIFIELDKKNREIGENINRNIEDLFYKETDIGNLNESIKKNGDRIGLESEIAKLKEEIAELMKKIEMSDEDIKKHKEYSEKIESLKVSQEKVDKNLHSIIALKSRENLSIPSITQQYLDSLDTETKNVLENSLKEVLATAEKKWKETIEDTYREKEEQKKGNQSKLEEFYKLFNPLLEKIQKSKSLKEKNKTLEEEEKKLNEITNQETNLRNLKESYSKLIESIVDNHSRFFDNLSNAEKEILSKQKSILGDLEFSIEILFRNNFFKNSFIEDVCNLKNIGGFENGFLKEYKLHDNLSFKKDVEKIIKGILEDKLTLKNSYTKKQAITKLTEPWFIFHYIIKQNGDEISEMSPGKKSFILLKLLIELDNSKCPILIDQPEDDLDNRSIYNELVKFIKTKKKERQIIVATHNPNLVVGADAECVIVANQKGHKSENRTYQFEYIQGSLEHTSLNESSEFVLEQRGIQEHVCDILEGGKIAFEQRKKKYKFV